MTKQELINKLEKDPIEEYVYGTDVDPLVVEGKLNLILKFLKEGDSRGTDVMFDGVYQDIVNFISDPQAQIDSLKSSIAANVDGIAHVEQIKQDKLPQVDLDNIASINQLKEDIAGKQDKLSQAQLQAIGEVDAVKSIALDNQTNKASIGQVNTNMLGLPSKTRDELGIIAEKGTQDKTATANGWATISLVCGGGEVSFLNVEKEIRLATSLTGYTSFAIPVEKGDTIRLYCDNKPTRIIRSYLIHSKEVQL